MCWVQSSSSDIPHFRFGDKEKNCVRCDHEWHHNYPTTTTDMLSHQWLVSKHQHTISSFIFPHCLHILQGHERCINISWVTEVQWVPQTRSRHILITTQFVFQLQLRSYMTNVQYENASDCYQYIATGEGPVCQVVCWSPHLATVQQKTKSPKCCTNWLYAIQSLLGLRMVQNTFNVSQYSLNFFGKNCAFKPVTHLRCILMVPKYLNVTTATDFYVETMRQDTISTYSIS